MAEFFIVDVFTDKKFSGNPLAVVLDSGEYAANQMQAIARQFNFSETTFAQIQSKGGTFPVRIFTPTQEIPFAGHPTLGTAWVLRELTGRRERVTLALGVGPVSVDFEHSGGCEIAWMQPPRPELGKAIPQTEAVRCLGLLQGDHHPSLPSQHVSIGVAFAMIPLASLDALGRVNIDRAARARLGNIGSGPIATFVFCEQTREADHHFSARLFFEADGLREDPATGAANVCLGALLEAQGYGAGQGLSIVVEQGFEMGRPSLVHVRVTNPLPGQIAVGGGVRPVARGTVL